MKHNYKKRKSKPQDYLHIVIVIMIVLILTCLVYFKVQDRQDRMYLSSENNEDYKFNFIGNSNKEKIELVENKKAIQLFQDRPTIYVEGPTDALIWNKAMEINAISSSLFQILWIGRMNNNNCEFTGYTALDHTKKLWRAQPHEIKSKRGLIYDCDAKKEDEKDNKLMIKGLAFNTLNTYFTKGIENFLNLPEGFSLDPFYKEITKTTSKEGYGEHKTVTEKVFDKTKFCSHICNNLTIEEQELMFANFKPVLEEFVVFVNS